MDNPFAAKLTFEQQCAIYAFHHHRNTSYTVLAACFNIHPKTVRSICVLNKIKTLQQYKRVHAESYRLGVQGLWDTYVTNEMVIRIDATTMAQRLIESPEPPPTHSLVPNIESMSIGDIVNARGGFRRFVAQMYEYYETSEDDYFKQVTQLLHHVLVSLRQE